MMTIHMNIIQTTGFAVIIAAIGALIQHRVSILRRLTIPAPVVGGVIFAIVHTILRMTGALQFEFDQTLQEFFQTLFFTTVGFTASVQMLKSSGSQATKMLILTIILIVCQNLLAIGMSKVVNIPPLLGILMGSSSMVGGPGTTGAVAPSIAELGYNSALTVGFAAATFGIAAGSLIGGPFATWKINSKNVETSGEAIDENQFKDNIDALDGSNDKISGSHLISMFMLILAVTFFGTYLTQFFNYLLSHVISAVQLPSYLGASLLAFAIRNISDKTPKFTIQMDEMNTISSLVLKIFLAIALLNLQLWELTNIGIPMLIILFTQVLFIFLFANFVVIPIFGLNYDSIVTTTGLLGYGLGASYNAVASMSEVTHRYGNASTSAIIIPLATSIFCDFVNVVVIYSFIGFIQ